MKAWPQVLQHLTPVDPATQGSTPGASLPKPILRAPISLEPAFRLLLMICMGKWRILSTRSLCCIGCRVGLVGCGNFAHIRGPNFFLGCHDRRLASQASQDNASFVSSLDAQTSLRLGLSLEIFWQHDYCDPDPHGRNLLQTRHAAVARPPGHPLVITARQLRRKAQHWWCAVGPDISQDDGYYAPFAGTSRRNPPSPTDSHSPGACSTHQR